MPKRTPLEDIRRRDLIEAAHRVFMGHGLQGLTTARICAEAGVSAGLLTYYFKGKEDVLFAMVRLNNRILSEDVARRLRAARTPWDRLVAVVEGNFAPAIFEPNVANAWLSLCAHATANPRFARLQRIFYLRLRSNVAQAFGPALPGDLKAGLTLTTAAMIDGLWLRRAFDPALTSALAVDLTLTAVAARLSSDQRARLAAA